MKLDINLTPLSIVFFIINIQIYGSNAGFFDGIWTENDFKFLMIEVVTILVAILMLYSDKKSQTPKTTEVLLTFLLASLFVFFGYEYAIYSNTPTVFAMMIAFTSGVFSLNIIQYLKTKILDIITKYVNKWLNGL